MTTLGQLGQAALMWADEGVPVFALRPRDKVPANSNGCKGATRDAFEIESVWGSAPTANIGGATGVPSGLFVLDVDGDQGRQSLAELERKNGRLPTTRTTRTPRGAHLWFHMPANCDIRNSASKIGPGLDIRGTGGYVVLPPSVHPSGGIYELADDDRPAEPPDWLVSLATAEVVRRQVLDLPVPAKAQPASSDQARMAGIVRAAAQRIRQATEGCRNDTVNRECYTIGGWIDGLHADFDQVATILEAATADAGQSPGIVRRALEDGQKNGRGRPPDEPDRLWTPTALTAPPVGLDRPAVRARKSPLPAVEGVVPGTGLAVDAKSAAMDLLRSSVESGMLGPVFADDAALLLVTQPGRFAGQVEQLLLELPAAHRSALRRASRVLSHESRGAKPAVERTPSRKPESAELPRIVTHGQTWWIFDPVKREYLAVQQGLSVVELARMNPDISVWAPKASGEGVRQINSIEAYDFHGVTAKQIRWTYESSGPSWDPDTRVLDMPGACVARGDARRSQEVEIWLELLTDSPDKFLDWLAVASVLNRATSALQLVGPSSVGKAMLAAALGTHLGGGMDYKDAVGNFNAGLITRPLVKLDEGIANSEPDRFRSLTGNSSHQVTEKGRMPEELCGYPRVLITSNEKDPIRLGNEELSAESQEAIGRRILVLSCTEAARIYLRSIGGFATTADWIKKDGALLCHLRWLAKNRVVPAGDRFLVEGDAEEWVATAHTRVGVSRSICHAYRAYKDLAEDGKTAMIQQPQPFHFGGEMPEGHVGVSVRGLQANWTLLLGPGERVPSHIRIVDALRRLSGLDGPVRPGHGAGQVCPRVYPVLQVKLVE